MLTLESIARMQVYDAVFATLLDGREVADLSDEHLATIIGKATAMTEAQMLNLSPEQKAAAFDAWMESTRQHGMVVVWEDAK